MIKVGDKVTTKSNWREYDVIRTVTRVWQDENCQSGWLCNVDGGKDGTPITELDISWLKLMESKDEKD